MKKPYKPEFRKGIAQRRKTDCTCRIIGRSKLGGDHPDPHVVRLNSYEIEKRTTLLW